MTTPDAAAHIFAAEYADRIENGGLYAAEVVAPEMIERAIRADRQQFAPYINIIRKAIVNTEKNPMLGYLPLMVIAAQFADAIEEGMTA